MLTRTSRARRAFRPSGVKYRDAREACTGASGGLEVDRWGILIYDPGGAAPGRLPAVRRAFGARSSGSSCVMLRSAEAATGQRVPRAVRGSARRSAPDGTSSLPSAPASAERDFARRAAFNDRGGRSESAARYLRVADAPERSAQLAEEHARRERSKGRRDSEGIELSRARRARAAARRGRELASRLN